MGDRCMPNEIRCCSFAFTPLPDAAERKFWFRHFVPAQIILFIITKVEFVCMRAVFFSLALSSSYRAWMYVIESILSPREKRGKKPRQNVEWETKSHHLFSLPLACWKMCMRSTIHNFCAVALIWLFVIAHMHVHVCVCVWELFMAHLNFECVLFAGAAALVHIHFRQIFCHIMNKRERNLCNNNITMLLGELW